MASSIKARGSVSTLFTYLSDLLSDQLGTFQLTGEPAIWVEPPYLTEKANPTGLAVIINRFKQFRGSRSAGISAMQVFDWRVVLRTYDTSEAGISNMEAAIEKMEQSFPNHRQRVLQTVETAYPQVTFLLDTAKFINLVS